MRPQLGGIGRSIGPQRPGLSERRRQQRLRFQSRGELDGVGIGVCRSDDLLGIGQGRLAFDLDRCPVGLDACSGFLGFEPELLCLTTGRFEQCGDLCLAAGRLVLGPAHDVVGMPARRLGCILGGPRLLPGHPRRRLCGGDAALEIFCLFLVVAKGVGDARHHRVDFGTVVAAAGTSELMAVDGGRSNAHRSSTFPDPSASRPRRSRRANPGGRS